MHPAIRLSTTVLLATTLICVIFPCRIECFAPIIGQRSTNQQHVKHYQPTQNTQQPLHGIMDEVNSDAFDLSDLLKNDDEADLAEMEKAYECSSV